MTTSEHNLDILLEIAGIQPGPDDLGPMLKAFATAAEQSALVFGVADARYEEPGLVFSARAVKETTT